VWPVFLAAGAALVLAALATPRLALASAGVRAALLALAAWTLLAVLAPTVLGIDHRGLQSIVHAGDPTALHKGFGSYPLKALAPISACAGLLALAAAWRWRRAPAPALSG
jgi:O-antigen ligase